ncbi:hypothetical protein ASPWEDRAFT_27073 [Aspergillus wentii DTO 134E9]|uniref:Zn(2)-C6 fungal-type domain-containing protein n=1 Tax=Aspergillus wentii DTO 134E9 TaxID=1073089 RepID=A0A1L9RS15_ASPWE|nr:uncharacterized protein ASPWEDRAFT_27073 [Aspergillus wentii DTO 134E9]KAI9930553.1 hypothetical protein MW887_011307 [Aspergillus wentii]OJJ37715.1 hypothetical protein ASPWEDRAFT_27073 [Aspergillus wentii DTO 134E9]
MSAQQDLAAETAPKDCPRCQRRRIKCDRGLPGCKKCAKRSLECPGYGLRYKWVQGVASRGKLQGKSIPVRNETTPTAVATLADSHILPSLSNPMLAEAQTPHVSRLIPYFQERVARRLAWVDGPDNPWRLMVMPLVETSETVLSSVLALTAHDLASQYPHHDPWYGKFQAISKSYQNKALGLLARELGLLRTSSASQPNTGTASTLTLASVIILCNNELLTAQTAGWRVHLQAAREVIRAEIDRPYLQRRANRIEEFFIQEFYATSVWTQVTTFNEIDEIVQNPLASSRDAVFTDFIRIIHQITQAERLKTRSKLLQMSQSYPMPTIDIYTELELARGNAIRVSKNIQFWSDTDQCNFDHLVWMYHHACLIYSCQALSDPATVKSVIKCSRDEILSHLHSLTGTGNETFAQDLVWPLFITGTEVRESRARQKIIERELTTVMRISRILDRHRVLSFLQTWWNLQDDQCTSWIEWARKQSLGCDFLIV